MKGRGIGRHVVAAVLASFAATGLWQLLPSVPRGAEASTRHAIASFDGLPVRASDAVIAPPPDDFGAPADPPVAPPAALRFGKVVPAGGTWAVVIGVNDYPGKGHDLESAVNDADDMDIALRGMAVSDDHVINLRDRQVNRASIALAVDWLNAHAAPDAVAVFFYAGHVRKVGSGRESIVGSDGSLFADSELAAKLNGLRAKRAWIAIAACYGGGFNEVLEPGRVLTGAAGPNELAYENSLFDRSYMVEYMVHRAMIGGFAPTSVQASFTWARDQLARDYPNRLPYEIDRAGAPLVLRPAGAEPRPAAKPAPSGASSGGSQPRPSGGPPAPTPNPPTTPPSPSGCSVSALGVRLC